MNVLEKILEEIKDKCEELSKKHWGDDERHLIGKGMQTMYIQIEKIIRSHMDEAKDDGWIPVEERLPESQTEVLCCFDNGEVKSLWQKWNESEDVEEELSSYMTQDYEALRVIAWQPLPEPHKGE